MGMLALAAEQLGVHLDLQVDARICSTDVQCALNLIHLIGIT